MRNSTNPASGGQNLRLAKVYDGRGADGRPIVNRPALDPRQREAFLTYLESFPVVLSARGFDPDEFAPTDQDVPLNFRTDGTWVWAGSVSHYLRKHGLAPDPGLVEHIQSRGFALGTVDKDARQRAVRLITG